MSDDHKSAGTLVIRAWQEPDGSIRARVTHAVEAEEPPLQMVQVETEPEIVALVKDWLERVRSRE